MKLLLEIDLDIQGDWTEEKVRENFLEWFELLSRKISPDEDDDECQVWVESMEVVG
jgi:hypothetical protein